jgi:mono/diheme cytochrome c family protein
MKGQIALGLLALLALIGVLVVVAIGEPQRMADVTRAFDARQIETGATLFEANCRPCHGPQGQGIEGVAPALNARDLFDGSRLAAVSFSGTLPDYVRGVVAAGRPVPSAGTNYPQRMPTWGQQYGGPLRSDQVDALVAYILNWKDRALAASGAPPTPSGPVVGTDITVSLPQGDAQRGKALAESGLGCSGCHILAAVGPAWIGTAGAPGIGTRAEQRYQAAGYSGKATSAEQYLFESIVAPNAYIEEGFQPNIMPLNFADRLSSQDMADLIAYMLSLK